jgi:opacity protein-like surface antigen
MRNIYLRLPAYAGLILVLACKQIHAAEFLKEPGPRPEGSEVSLKDAPVFPPIWTGLYFGGHAGGIWGNTGVNDDFTYVGDPQFIGSLGGAGFIGGAQAGYNIQRGHFVFGIEGDIGYLGISASKSESFQENSCSHTYVDTGYTPYNGALCHVDAKYSTSSGLYGDITGRLGYSVGNLLFYAKGGLALLDASFKANYLGGTCLTNDTCGSGGPATFNFGRSETLPGWTAGGGAEYALNSSWSFKVEYQHFDFGDISYNYSGAYVIPCVVSFCYHQNGHYTALITGRTYASITADAVTVGLNYHLNK